MGCAGRTRKLRTLERVQRKGSEPCFFALLLCQTGGRTLLATHAARLNAVRLINVLTVLLGTTRRTDTTRRTVRHTAARNASIASGPRERPRGPECFDAFSVRAAGAARNASLVSEQDSTKQDSTKQDSTKLPPSSAALHEGMNPPMNGTS